MEQAVKPTREVYNWPDDFLFGHWLMIMHICKQYVHLPLDASYLVSKLLSFML